MGTGLSLSSEVRRQHRPAWLRGTLVWPGQTRARVQPAAFFGERDGARGGTPLPCGNHRPLDRGQLRVMLRAAVTTSASVQFLGHHVV
jgi:hypothetical protein